MSTQNTPVAPVRSNVRLVLLNDRNELLLMKVELPDRTFWCTIGGGIELGETPEQAARREAREETGLIDQELHWGPAIWYGEHLLPRAGVTTLHKETFVLVRTRRSELSTQYLTEEEKQVVKAFRWWSLEALQHTAEFVVPPSLLTHLRPLLSGQVPTSPLLIDLGDARPDECRR